MQFKNVCLVQAMRSLVKGNSAVKYFEHGLQYFHGAFCNEILQIFTYWTPHVRLSASLTVCLSVCM
jgi:hypothetical protein